MSIRTKTVSIALLTTALATASLACLQRERIAFVSTCWGNGNGLAECHCTFNALDELPVSYRSLAVSWAHDGGTAYAAGVVYLVAAETWRVGVQQMRPSTESGDKPRTLGRWARTIVTRIGRLALQQVAPDLASVLDPVAATLPLVGDAVNRLATAQRVLGRHCGTGDTFIVRLNDRLQAATLLLDWAVHSK